MYRYLLAAMMLIGCNATNPIPDTTRYDDRLATMVVYRINRCIVGGQPDAVCVEPAVPVLQSWCSSDAVPEDSRACRALAQLQVPGSAAAGSYLQHDDALAAYVDQQLQRCRSQAGPLAPCLSVELDTLESWCDLDLVPLEDSGSCHLLELILLDTPE